MSVELMARRYASALADVVGSDYKTVQSELLVFEGMMKDSKELTSMFANPSLARAGKVRVLNQLIEKSKPTKTTANFLRVLLENGRMVNLAEINRMFVTVLSERSGVTTARITSARDLSAKEQKELEAGLEKMLGSKVDLKFKVDEEIIGGIVTRIDSTVYDSSVKTQLQNLKQQLVNG